MAKSSKRSTKVVHMAKVASNAVLHYRIQALYPNQHLFQVTLRIAQPDANQVVQLPTWIAGSYLTREFAQNLQSLCARQGRRVCTIEQLDKHSWQIDCVADKSVEISYQILAHDNSVRAAWLDDVRGFFNATSLCLMVLGQTDSTHTITIEPVRNKDWQVATGLRPVQVDRQGFGIYCAPNYDVLADCPVEMSDFWMGTFSAYGVPHQFVISTPPANLDSERLLKDTQRICETEIRFWHPIKPHENVPYERYVFMLNAVHDGYGGLEHHNSTALVASRKNLPLKGKETGENYVVLLGLISHEYFHNWNIKRLKPADFVPYDYVRENYTELLWFFEGMTSYYDDLMLLRSGCIDQAGYINQLQKNVDAVYNTPGRFIHSAAQSSFEAWTKLYRRDAHSPNRTVSYYTKGALIALCLDLTLRKEGKTTLDAIMRALYKRCYSHQTEAASQGLCEQDVLAVLRELGGRSFAKEIKQWVHETKDLPIAELLKAHGIIVEAKKASIAQQWGLFCKSVGGNMVIQTVLSGGAAEAAGFSPDDEWLGIELHGKRGQGIGSAWRINSLEDMAQYLPATHSKSKQPAFTAIISRDKRLLRRPFVLPNTAPKRLHLVAEPLTKIQKNKRSWPLG